MATKTESKAHKDNFGVDYVISYRFADTGTHLRDPCSLVVLSNMQIRSKLGMASKDLFKHWQGLGFKRQSATGARAHC